ncbi:hypothetical protein FHQ18_11365 [Deferribacter autotrophicus]|uniref:Thioredoxin-like fold domain-containing protein n=1 Tax=Deferribacter autotrophicus TaxID=500465 RepID=A0A5A8EZQ6_9BACT|nr:thioredoxin domain-containing protein [Deferribacter autotrophicus]KAA0257160.1 hypothetical protein FHQ18_11365 [Deferribacter autotrophicus]
MRKIFYALLIVISIVSFAAANLKEDIASNIKNNLIRQGAKNPKVKVTILEKIKDTNIYFVKIIATGDNIKRPINAFLLSDGKYLYPDAINLISGEKMLETLKSKYNIVKFTKKDLKNFTLIEGNKDAKNTIVMITDFECPFCKKAHFLIKELLKNKSKKNYAFYILHYPLKNMHKKAELFSKILIAGAKFGLDFRDELYNFNNKSLSDKKILEIFANKTKDPKKFKKIALSKETSEQIKRNIEKGNSLGVKGTPVIIINGKRIDGFNQELIKKYINEI